MLQKCISRGSVRIGMSLLLGASAALAPNHASGQLPTGSASANDPLKRAREQFGQALALQTAGDWAGALALLNEVVAVRATPQVRFNLALCEEKLGRLVSALGHYELAATDARGQHADRVADEVEARLDSLRRRVPRLTVERGRGAETATIAVDGVTVGDSVLGTSMLVDPGPHTVEAKAVGFQPFRRSFRVAERQTETLEVTLEAEPARPSTSRATSHTESRTATYGYVMGGVGIVSLGASGVFFALRADKIAALNDACPDRRCPPSSQADINAGKLDTTLASVTLAVGVAAVAGGMLLVLTSRSKPSSSVALAPALGGAQLLGSF